MFIGSAGNIGGFISCELMNLDLKSSEFTLTEKSKPAATFGFIHFTSMAHNFTGTNLTLNANALAHLSDISIMAINAVEVHFTYTQIICPDSLGIG